MPLICGAGVGVDWIDVLFNQHKGRKNKPHAKEHTRVGPIRKFQKHYLCSLGDGEVDITEFDITECDVTFFQETDITESDVTKKGN